MCVLDGRFFFFNVFLCGAETMLWMIASLVFVYDGCVSLFLGWGVFRLFMMGVFRFFL